MAEPLLGRLEINGQAPSLLFDSPTIVVPKGELRLVTDTGLKLNGQAATVSVEAITNPEPGTVSLSLAGQAPLSNEAHNRLPGSIALTLTGHVPVAGIASGPNTVFPPAGVLEAWGYTPAMEIIINDGESSMSVTGLAPVVANSGVPPNIQYPPAGNLALTSYDPQRASGLLLGGHAPTVGGEIQIPTLLGELSVFGRQPAAIADNPSVEPGTGSLSTATHAPSIEGLVTPATGSAELTGLQIQPLAYSWVVRTNAGALTATTYLAIDNPAEPGTDIVNPTATTDAPNRYNICDRSGFRAKPGELVKTWDGLYVLPEFWEPRNEQDFVTSKAEKQRGAKRPEPVGSETFIEDLYPDGVDPEDL